MLTVKTILKQSNIHGMGCFAAQDIKMGSIVWIYQEHFDLVITDKQFEELKPMAKEYVQNFCYYSTIEGGYMMCMDNSKYTNHSDNPNVKVLDKSTCIAARDIKEGEEITENYYTFDEHAEKKLNKKSPYA